LVAAAAAEPVARVVREIMRADVVTVDAEESLLEADRIMRLARIRHLPVLRDSRLVGVISHRDLLEASIAKLDEATPGERLDHLRATRVEQVLKGAPETVEADCLLRDAALRVLRLKIGCLPVVEASPEGPRLVGILTESDLLRVAYAPDFVGASD